MVKDRMQILTESNTVKLLLDDETLLNKSGMSWEYIKKEGNTTIHEQIPIISDDLFHIFIDDIILQLENGVDRNNLTMNIPRIKQDVIIGNRVVPNFK